MKVSSDRSVVREGAFARYVCTRRQLLLSPLCAWSERAARVFKHPIFASQPLSFFATHFNSIYILHSSSQLLRPSAALNHILGLYASHSKLLSTLHSSLEYIQALNFPTSHLSLMAALVLSESTSFVPSSSTHQHASRRRRLLPTNLPIVAMLKKPFSLIRD